MEFEAVDEGTIISLAVAEGADGVKVGTVIALLAAEGEDTGAAPSKPAKAEKSEKAQATESKPAAPQPRPAPELAKRSEEHTSELQSLMRISYAVFCLKK